MENTEELQTDSTLYQAKENNRKVSRTGEILFLKGDLISVCGDTTSGEEWVWGERICNGSNGWVRKSYLKPSEMRKTNVQKKHPSSRDEKSNAATES
jgi:hypothetical protein